MSLLLNKKTAAVILCLAFSGCRNSGSPDDVKGYREALFEGHNVPADTSGNVATNTNTEGPGMNFSRAIITFDYGVYSGTSYDNQKANPGETVEVAVFLKNTTATRIEKVFATLSSGNTDVTPTLIGGGVVAHFDSGYNKDYIEPGSESLAGSAYSPNWGYEYSSQYSYGFKVGLNVSRGTAIPFTLTITDALSNTWTSSFSLTVE